MDTKVVSNHAEREEYGADLGEDWSPKEVVIAETIEGFLILPRFSKHSLHTGRLLIFASAHKQELDHAATPSVPFPVILHIQV